MINSYQIVYTVVIISIFGFGTSLACSGERIQACKRHIQGFEGASSTSPEMCKALRNVINCFERETSTCDASFKGVLEQAMKALIIAEKECQNPGSAREELGDVESCETDKFQECTNKFKMSAESASGPAESCLLIGDARKCIDDFKQGCKSDYFVSLMNSQLEVVEQQEQMCRESGYPVVQDNGYSGSDTSSNSKSNGKPNGVEVDLHKDNSGSDDNQGPGGKIKNMPTKNNNSGNDGGGCGSLHPMFFTLVASGVAILAYSHMFL